MLCVIEARGTESTGPAHPGTLAPWQLAGHGGGGSRGRPLDSAGAGFVFGGFATHEIFFTIDPTEPDIQ